MDLEDVDECFVHSHVLGLVICFYIVSFISSWYGSHDSYFHVHILDLIVYIIFYTVHVTYAISIM